MPIVFSNDMFLQTYKSVFYQVICLQKICQNCLCIPKDTILIVLLILTVQD